MSELPARTRTSLSATGTLPCTSIVADHDWSPRPGGEAGVTVSVAASAGALQAMEKLGQPDRTVAN